MLVDIVGPSHRIIINKKYLTIQNDYDKKEIIIMKVQEFIEKVKNDVQKASIDEHYIIKMLEVKKYISFQDKRKIVELIVQQNTQEIDGILRNDSITQYISFVMAMLTAHTNLELTDNPIDDYDMLSENSLLTLIINTFRTDYDDCDVLLKMALASKMEDNNTNVIIGKFLNSILNKLDSVGEALKDKFDNIDVKDILGTTFKEEDLAALSSFLDKLK